MKTAEIIALQNNATTKPIGLGFINPFGIVTPIFNPYGIVAPAQQKKVKVFGTVTDSDGLPIPLASVNVKGNSNIGITTNNNGKFSLEVYPNDILEVRYNGFQQVNVSASNLAAPIVLLEDSNSLDEVTLTVKKKNNNLKYILGGLAILGLGVILISKSKKDKPTPKKGLKAIEVIL